MCEMSERLNNNKTLAIKPSAALCSHLVRLQRHSAPVPVGVLRSEHLICEGPSDKHPSVWQPSEVFLC